MSEPVADFEALLRQALAPVEPPEELEERLELTLGSLVELAAEELEAWELRAMRDPRNWPRSRGRSAAAVIGGDRRAVGLVRRAHPAPAPQAPRAQSDSVLELAERTLRDVGARGAAGRRRRGTLIR